MAAIDNNVINILFRVANPQVFAQIQALRNANYTINIKGTVDSGLQRLLGTQETGPAGNRTRRINITADTTQFIAELQKIQRLYSQFETQISRTIVIPPGTTAQGVQNRLLRAELIARRGFQTGQFTPLVQLENEVRQARTVDAIARAQQDFIRARRIQELHERDPQQQRRVDRALERANVYNPLDRLLLGHAGLANRIGQEQGFSANQTRQIEAGLRNQRFIDFGRLRSQEAAQQLGFSFLFGGTRAAAGAALGGAIGGAPGVFLGSAIIQKAGDFADRVFENAANALRTAAEAGLEFQRSVIGVASIFQASTKIVGPGGQDLSIPQQLAFQEQRARGLQVSGRQRLAPLGISGNTEVALLRAITAGASRRGGLGNSQILDLAEGLGAAAQSLTPEILSNPSILSRDIRDIITGSPNASRTLLGSALGPDLIKQISTATTPEDFNRINEALKGFVDTLKNSGDAVISFNKISAVAQNSLTSLGDALLRGLQPALKKLADAVTSEEFQKGATQFSDHIFNIAKVVGNSAIFIAGAFKNLSDFLNRIGLGDFLLSAVGSAFGGAVGAQVAVGASSLFKGDVSKRGELLNTLSGTAQEREQARLAEIETRTGFKTGENFKNSPLAQLRELNSFLEDFPNSSSIPEILTDLPKVLKERFDLTTGTNFTQTTLAGRRGLAQAENTQLIPQQLSRLNQAKGILLGQQEAASKEGDLESVNRLSDSIVKIEKEIFDYSELRLKNEQIIFDSTKQIANAFADTSTIVGQRLGIIIGSAAKRQELTNLGIPKTEADTIAKAETANKLISQTVSEAEKLNQLNSTFGGITELLANFKAGKGASSLDLEKAKREQFQFGLGPISEPVQGDLIDFLNKEKEKEQQLGNAVSSINLRNVSQVLDLFKQFSGTSLGGQLKPVALDALTQLQQTFSKSAGGILGTERKPEELLEEIQKGAEQQAKIAESLPQIPAKIDELITALKDFVDKLTKATPEDKSFVGPLNSTSNKKFKRGSILNVDTGFATDDSKYFGPGGIFGPSKDEDKFPIYDYPAGPPNATVDFFNRLGGKGGRYDTNPIYDSPAGPPKAESTLRRVRRENGLDVEGYPGALAALGQPDLGFMSRLSPVGVSGDSAMNTTANMIIDAALDKMRNPAKSTFDINDIFRDPDEADRLMNYSDIFTDKGSMGFDLGETYGRDAGKPLPMRKLDNRRWVDPFDPLGVIKGRKGGYTGPEDAMSGEMLEMLGKIQQKYNTPTGAPTYLEGIDPKSIFDPSKFKEAPSFKELMEKEGKFPESIRTDEKSGQDVSMNSDIKNLTSSINTLISTLISNNQQLIRGLDLS